MVGASLNTCPVPDPSPTAGDMSPPNNPQGSCRAQRETRPASTDASCHCLRPRVFLFVCFWLFSPPPNFQGAHDAILHQGLLLTTCGLWLQLQAYFWPGWCLVAGGLPLYLTNTTIPGHCPSGLLPSTHWGAWSRISLDSFWWFVCSHPTWHHKISWNSRLILSVYFGKFSDATSYITCVSLICFSMLESLIKHMSQLLLYPLCFLLDTIFQISVSKCCI